MKHEKKIEWMAVWAAKNKMKLELEGEVGFGRPCVGVVSDSSYPDYMWYDEEFERVDNNGDVWCPENAYHKHPCVAVLGRGKEAEEQLYEWLKWFDENGFRLETGPLKMNPDLGAIGILLGHNRYSRMVRTTANKK